MAITIPDNNEPPTNTYEVKLWSCPKCGFTFDATHSNDTPEGGYTCPVCEEARLATENKALAEQNIMLNDELGKAEKQVTRLRKVIEWPEERLSMYCLYCGKFSSAMQCVDCMRRISQMPIFSAFMFNQQEALMATSPDESPVEECAHEWNEPSKPWKHRTCLKCQITEPYCHAQRDGDCDWTECPQKVNYQRICPVCEETRLAEQVRQLREAVEWALPYLQDMWRRERYEVPGLAIEALAAAVGVEWSHTATSPDSESAVADESP